MKNRTSLLRLKSKSAKDFFLKQESYCSIDLPPYFSFKDLLEKLSAEIENKSLTSIANTKRMKELDDINYTLYTNKDGKLSWRPLQIIHPLVYVSLVHKITEQKNWKKIKNRFKDFQKNPKIRCLSIPVESLNKQSNKAQQILQWWEEVEQESITLSLEYNFVFDTDIADCYGSIYTHSIAWALETKDIAKQHINDKSLLGNIIDKSIQSAQYQQTNGIPQGSVLMDFIAEMVLGYIDELLTQKFEENSIENYQILRYRDDYRIFVNNINDGEIILKLLSEILVPFGLKLNSSKTKSNSDVITASIKKDKLAWLQLPDPESNTSNLQKYILVIRQHSLNYPNSGSLIAALSNFQKRLKLESKKNIKQYSNQIISIVTDIAYHNPKCISICCAIISQFLLELNRNVYNELATKVYNKLKTAPNSGFAQIWLQRMLKNAIPTINFSEKLCLLVAGDNQIKIWNHSWITSKKILKILENNSFFNNNIFDNLDEIISRDEFDIFIYPNS